MRPRFVLLHSPALGPRTWQPVAARLAELGEDAVVPSLLAITDGVPPYWPRAVAAVQAAVADDRPLVLVAHSNAGLFVPVMAAELRQPVVASVFVDAALPARSGPSAAAPDGLLPLLQGLADGDGRLPGWTDWWGEEDVAALFPDAASRREVAAEQPRLPLDYFTQRIPTPATWDDHPHTYVHVSPAYDETAAEAESRGWTVRRLPGQHLHQLVDPHGVAALLVEASGRAGDLNG